MDLVCLNDFGGASKVILGYCAQLARTVKDRPLLGVEFGTAYGGGVQRIGRLWKPVGGTVYGFDTFSGYPEHLVPDEATRIATGMEEWYSRLGREGLAFDFQRRVLDEEGLDNVILRLGLIDEHSLDGIPYLHYALLDVDFVPTMTLCWQLVRPLMLPGGYLCLHDVLPVGHIAGLEVLHQAVKDSGEYDTVLESAGWMLAALRRNSK